jgi:osmoprotectant transport system permease protein
VDTSLSFANVLKWLNDPANWQGADGVIARLGQQVYYAIIAVAIAVVIAIPLGLVIGHTGRGVVVVAGMANALRAIPTFGLLIYLVVLISPRSTAEATCRTYSRPRSFWYCSRFPRY